MRTDRSRTNSEAGRARTTAKTRDNTHGDFLISVESDMDIVGARQAGRELAAQLDFSPGDLTLIAASISELARNIILYAKRGEILLKLVAQGEVSGIVIVARDEGPGIPDISQALQDGFSTSRSLGLGLPGVRRLMDEFEIVSQVNRGTTVTVKKWRK